MPRYLQLFFVIKHYITVHSFYVWRVEVMEDACFDLDKYFFNIFLAYKLPLLFAFQASRVYLQVKVACKDKRTGTTSPDKHSYRIKYVSYDI